MTLWLLTKKTTEGSGCGCHLDTRIVVFVMLILVLYPKTLDLVWIRQILIVFTDSSETIHLHHGMITIVLGTHILTEVLQTLESCLKKSHTLCLPTEDQTNRIRNSQPMNNLDIL